MTVKLSKEALKQVASTGIKVPTYDLSAVKPSIFHIGPSSFFRAHLAVFADDILHKQHEAGQPLTAGIVAVCPRRPDVRDALQDQDNLYTVNSKGKNIDDVRVIGSIRDIMVLKENPQAVIEAAASPDITTLSLTVTQAGYYYTKGTGLDFNAPDIQKDLAAANNDELTSIGLIVASLDLRRQRGIAPPTILSLDNLPENGHKLRSAVLAYAREAENRGKVSQGLNEWISEFTQFPTTMVDRITPGTDPDQIRHITSKGILDNLPVKAEPMPPMACVIENKLSIDPVTGASVPLPALTESKGVVISDNVAAYELMKLRSLNGAHMALGTVGHLMGDSLAHEAIQNPLIKKYIQGFMSEVGQTLLDTPGIDHDEYRESLMQRINNDQIRDPLTRLARNGSKDKVQPRLIDPLRDCLTNEGRTHSHIAFSIATWVEYLKKMDKTGTLPGMSEANDPYAVEIGLLDQITPNMTDIAPLLAIPELRFNGMGKRADLIEEINDHLKNIQENGLEKALTSFLETQNFTFDPEPQKEPPAGVPSLDIH